MSPGTADALAALDRYVSETLGDADPRRAFWEQLVAFQGLHVEQTMAVKEAGRWQSEGRRRFRAFARGLKNSWIAGQLHCTRQFVGQLLSGRKQPCLKLATAIYFEAGIPAHLWWVKPEASQKISTSEANMPICEASNPDNVEEMRFEPMPPDMPEYRPTPPPAPPQPQPPPQPSWGELNQRHRELVEQNRERATNPPPQKSL